MLEREFALDVSRLVWRSWSRRLATGIDRVCRAYLEYFGDRSQAVVQYRGVARFLSAGHSDALFKILLDDDDDGENFRRRLLALAPKALSDSQSVLNCDGAYYINVGHTDIDLDRSMRWIDTCGLRSIYLIHDLIPLTHSEFCNPSSIVRHRGRVTNALNHAAGIITNSNASARDLERFAVAEGLRLPPVIPVWLGGARIEKPDALPFAAHSYFVCVGTIEARKNHYLLLQIWRRLVERLGAAAPRLVIIGQKGAQASHVENMIERCTAIQDHVITLPYCSDEELGRWIGAARALLMPSFAEGFGLPIIEALQIGTPVIASDLPCFREIGAGIPTLLDPLDAMAWEQTITGFLDNGPDRSRQYRLLRDYRAPTWTDHFAQVEAWLETLPRHGAGRRLPSLAAAGPNGRNFRKPPDDRRAAMSPLHLFTQATSEPAKIERSRVRLDQQWIETRAQAAWSLGS